MRKRMRKWIRKVSAVMLMAVLIAGPVTYAEAFQYADASSGETDEETESFIEADENVSEFIKADGSAEGFFEVNEETPDIYETEEDRREPETDSGEERIQDADGADAVYEDIITDDEEGSDHGSQTEGYEDDARKSSYDPVTEEYLKTYASKRYTGTDNIQLVNLMVVKQTLADAEVTPDDATIDSIMYAENTIDYLLAVIPAVVAVYSMSDDSDYYVALADTMQGTKGCTSSDFCFAYYNNDGECADGCVYDCATGIAYIPKSLYLNEKGEIIPCHIQLQILQRISPGSVKGTARAVTGECGSDGTDPRTVTADIFSMETVVMTDSGQDSSSICVSVNGLPLDRDRYVYDKESGKITIAMSSAAISSVTVETKEEKGGSPAVYPDGANSWTMNRAGKIGIPAGASVGDKYEGTAMGCYCYSTENPGDISLTYILTDLGTTWSAVTGDRVYPSYEYDKGALYNLPNATFSFYINLDSTASVNNFNFEDANVTLPLFCSHNSSPLGNVENRVNDTLFEFGIGVRILYMDADQGYCILGFVTEYMYGQTGFGMACFDIAEKTGSLQIIKSSDDYSLTSDRPEYDLKGAVYGAWGSRADAVSLNTAASSFAGKLITKDNSSKSSMTNKLDNVPFGTYYIREISAPDNYELDEDIYTVYVGGIRRDSSIVTLSLKDTPVPPDGRLSLVKASANDGITGGNDNYSLKGAVYTVYADSSLTEPVGEIITDETGAGNILELAPGTYYVAEERAPGGYMNDPEVYSVRVLSDETVILNVADQPYCGSLDIEKRDSKGAPMKDVSFVLYDIDEAKVREGVTGEDGVISFAGIPLGQYELVETKTAGGSFLLKDPVSVTFPLELTAEEAADLDVDISQCVYDEEQEIYRVYHFSYLITNGANLKLPLTGENDRQIPAAAAASAVMTGTAVCGFLGRKRHGHLKKEV